MGICTELVPIEDIITVLAGVPLRCQDADDENKLLSYVMGAQIDAEVSPSLSNQALESLKQQLPTSLARFGISELARFIIEAKAQSPYHIDRDIIIELLRREFGTSLPISPESQYRRQGSQIKKLFDPIGLSPRLIKKNSRCEDLEINHENSPDCTRPK